MPRVREVERELLLDLLPSSRDEGRDAIVEVGSRVHSELHRRPGAASRVSDMFPFPSRGQVRPGTGGGEASLFAAELLEMYMSYAQRKGWSYEVIAGSGSGCDARACLLLLRE